MNYEFEKVLGTGHFGKVKLASHKITGNKVAIKIISKTNLLIDNEILIMETLKKESSRMIQGSNHINFLNEIIETPTSVMLVMDYMSGGDLFEYLYEHDGKLPENKSKKFFQQIVAAVSFCHSKCIVHRDLKLENVFLDKDENVKLGDFGLSEIVEENQYLKTHCGSTKYLAPELVNGNLYIGQQVDVWALGICLFVLLCGCFPFDDEHTRNVYAKISSGKYTIDSLLSDSVKELIDKILQVDTSKRIKLPEIKKHEWLRDIV
jgi:serine/threonine protein kinase